MIENVLNGQAVRDIFIFDCHEHICGSDFDKTKPDNAARIVKTLDMLGVNSACLSSKVSFYSDYKTGNDITAQAVRDHSGRLYGYTVINPYYNQEAEIKRCMAMGGFLGLKIHVMFQNIAIDSELFDEGYSYADKIGLPILIHTWTKGEVLQAVNVAKNYKNTKVIIAHSAFTDDEARNETVNAVKTYDNVYADTTVSTSYDGSVEWVVNKMGSDKLLYGSDMNFFDSRQVFGRVMLAKIHDSDREKIFGLNAKQLFNL